MSLDSFSVPQAGQRQDFSPTHSPSSSPAPASSLAFDDSETPFITTEDTLLESEVVGRLKRAPRTQPPKPSGWAQTEKKGEGSIIQVEKKSVDKNGPSTDKSKISTLATILSRDKPAASSFKQEAEKSPHPASSTANVTPPGTKSTLMVVEFQSGGGDASTPVEKKKKNSLSEPNKAAKMIVSAKTHLKEIKQLRPSSTMQNLFKDKKSPNARSTEPTTTIASTTTTPASASVTIATQPTSTTETTTASPISLLATTDTSPVALLTNQPMSAVTASSESVPLKVVEAPELLNLDQTPKRVHRGRKPPPPPMSERRAPGPPAPLLDFPLPTPLPAQTISHSSATPFLPRLPPPPPTLEHPNTAAPALDSNVLAPTATVSPATSPKEAVSDILQAGHLPAPVLLADGIESSRVSLTASEYEGDSDTTSSSDDELDMEGQDFVGWKDEIARKVSLARDCFQTALRTRVDVERLSASAMNPIRRSSSLAKIIQPESPSQPPDLLLGLFPSPSHLPSSPLLLEALSTSPCSSSSSAPAPSELSVPSSSSASPSSSTSPLSSSLSSATSSPSPSSAPPASDSSVLAVPLLSSPTIEVAPSKVESKEEDFDWDAAITARHGGSADAEGDIDWDNLDKEIASVRKASRRREGVLQGPGEQVRPKELSLEEKIARFQENRQKSKWTPAAKLFSIVEKRIVTLEAHCDLLSVAQQDTDIADVLETAKTFISKAEVMVMMNQHEEAQLYFREHLELLNECRLLAEEMGVAVYEETRVTKNGGMVVKEKVPCVDTANMRSDSPLDFDENEYEDG